MRRAKQLLPAPGRTATAPVLRAAAGPAPKAAPPKPTPKPVAKPAGPAQEGTNEENDFAAAVVVPAGQPVAAARLVPVGPKASYPAPMGTELRGFLHRDGSAVQIAGAAGAVRLEAGESELVFGKTLVDAARKMLAGQAAPAKAVQRSAAGAPAADAASAVRTATTSSAGSPLPVASRGKLEAAYGADLGGVRVHTGAAAADSAARAVNAHAFATGSDVFFRSGTYQPGTPAGEKLLAHEVAHTVQQTSGVARSAAGPLAVSEPGDRVEREAEAAAERAVRGQPTNLRPAGPGVARLADGPAPAAPAAAPTPQPVAPAPAPATQATTAGPPPAAPAAPPPAGPVPAAEQQRPAAPRGEDGLSAVQAEVAAARAEQRRHDPAEREAEEARAAVGVTPEQAAGDGQAAQLGAMSRAERSTFDKAAFKRALRQKINELSAADGGGIADGDRAGAINSAVQGEVAAGRQAAAGGLQAATTQPPTPGPSAAGPPVPAAKAGPPPAVDARRAVPPPVPDERVSRTAEAAAVDGQMAAANVTPEQLRRANEPEFAAAADTRDAAHTQAEALPAQARAAEGDARQRAAGQMAETTQAGLAGLHTARGTSLEAARGQQTAGVDQHAALRARVAARFEGIYTATKTDVDTRLAALDAEVNRAFEDGAGRAKTAFYLFLTGEVAEYVLSRGIVFGLAGALLGDPAYTAIFDRGRRKYADEMELVIDAVATVVETGLNEVVARIARGKAELEPVIDLWVASA